MHVLFFIFTSFGKKNLVLEYYYIVCWVNQKTKTIFFFNGLVCIISYWHRFVSISIVSYRKKIKGTYPYLQAHFIGCVTSTKCFITFLFNATSALIASLMYSSAPYIIVHTLYPPYSPYIDPHIATTYIIYYLSRPTYIFRYPIW